MLPEKWTNMIHHVDYAFQPLVNTLNGKTFAVEALLRNVNKTGFPSIKSFFDAAYQERLLFTLDLALRKKAFHKFKKINFYHEIKLFYNYDPRVFEMPDYQLGITDQMLREISLTNDIVCFELNECYQITPDDIFRSLMSRIKERGFKLALDDFGAGFAGFELFYHSEPDFLKLDRFLISGIDKDLRKKTFCQHMVDMAKLLGVIVIAEGVETEAEFIICRKLGFDLVQGFYIQKPTMDVTELSGDYSSNIVPLKDSEAYGSRDVELIAQEIEKLDPIHVYDDVRVLFDKFHKNLQFGFFPVLDHSGLPLGIIHEKTIKKYVYSPYGIDLLRNKAVTDSLRRFVSKCPIAEITTPQEKILEIYINNPDSEGVIITKGQKYVGFLTAKSLLNIINEKNLTLAREINPLTKLPGNFLISQYLKEAFENVNVYHYLIYFDINNFKPFNDKNGFSQGDKAIIIVADILKKIYTLNSDFIGHVGGDDYFAGVKREHPADDEEMLRVQKVMEMFGQKVGQLHDRMEIVHGYYIGKDRSGKVGKMPILSICSGMLLLTPETRSFTLESITGALATLKRNAKNSPTKIAFAVHK